MKKIILMALTALFVCSCGQSYIDKYENICNEAKELISAASSLKEINNVMKQMRSEILELDAEYPDEKAKYDKAVVEDGAVYEEQKRRLKAINGVSMYAASKQRALMSKKKE